MLYMLLMAESVLVKDCKVVKNQTDRVFFPESVTTPLLPFRSIRHLQEGSQTDGKGIRHVI